MPKKKTKKPPQSAQRPPEDSIPASEVKNAWHGVLARVSQGRERIIVTRYGKPLAVLSPYDGADGRPESLFGWMPGSVTVHGDIVSPIDEEWAATSGGGWVGDADGGWPVSSSEDGRSDG